MLIGDKLLLLHSVCVQLLLVCGQGYGLHGPHEQWIVLVLKDMCCCAGIR